MARSRTTCGWASLAPPPRSSKRRRARRTRTSSSRSCRRAIRPSSASAACGCLGASASASRSRALLREARILVLDEALSSVDAESEAVIQEALDRLMRGRTTLIFAHRLSSVIGADRILVLDDGRVVESGRHAELMDRRGAYHRLMAAQLREGDATDGRLVEIAVDTPEGNG